MCERERVRERCNVRKGTNNCLYRSEEASKRKMYPRILNKEMPLWLNLYGLRGFKGAAHCVSDLICVYHCVLYERQEDGTVEKYFYMS